MGGWVSGGGWLGGQVRCMDVDSRIVSVDECCVDIHVGVGCMDGCGWYKFLINDVITVQCLHVHIAPQHISHYLLLIVHFAMFITGH